MARRVESMPFDGERWRADTSLSGCAPATRGIWIDWLLAMWEADRSGVLEGSLRWLAVIGRCTETEARSAIDELTNSKTADVTLMNACSYRIVNRRMKRSYEKRQGNLERQERFRNAARNVTLDNGDAEAFERFWVVFPKGRKKDKGVARAAFAKAITKVDSATIIAAATEYAASEVGMGQFVKMPTTWLNKEGWADDRAAWQDRDRPRKYATVSAAQFSEFYKNTKFADGSPQRHTSNPNHVFGTLRDGRQVECIDYPARTESVE